MPVGLEYDSIFGLSTEEKRVLEVQRPESVGMARRLEGMTPSGVLRLAAHVRGLRDRVGGEGATAERPGIANEQMSSLVAQERRTGLW